ncbi:MAG TPA: N-acetyltransferase [Elusimicrobia bacterium]|nr:MAG: GNAT family N-acetyltransferase [Elusimicrobia bacterium RIFOXYA12_FULL_49_49]OGS09254.1 MAG: GNAT family N-acetyltransferase [Elusimicrobia bacterium RIFOXYA1_FULL_47_7]OGS10898.1 MAG: GNAT family N-acetyltransferase [Elusimicrobia bacterium RIFOXYB1_FULL_48_9]OGS16356.1 MAG: GNAT family N-acetyltransferase [Elusimicrobia bacterium RIFOXYA2_FULL_47_53]OGS27264.1 MAG: GNAT family N-acetyltransferase [Elusimicrobia bacterium RIFOXYB12_FULL_50_12]OGS30466.1 MAG: GNAT family N-acetyltrans
MKIRHARIPDVKLIHSLIGFYADRKEMLHRPLNDIYENIQEFMVAEDKNKVVGCCALHVSWEDLAEIKALAVSADYQKKGIGKKLVAQCEKNAKTLGIKKTFALSFKPEFFYKFGYYKIAREKLPHKIWGECVKCPLFPDCGETPLMKDLVKPSKK